jgi:hypothetical protein
MMRELTLIGIRMESPNRAPVMMLRETEGYRYLPISIGSVEATAIAYEEQGLRPSRPLTHDLMRDLIEAFGVQIDAVEIVELRDARVTRWRSQSGWGPRSAAPRRCCARPASPLPRRSRPSWSVSASSWTASRRRTSPADSPDHGQSIVHLDGALRVTGM